LENEVGVPPDDVDGVELDAAEMAEEIHDTIRPLETTRRKQALVRQQEPSRVRRLQDHSWGGKMILRHEASARSRPRRRIPSAPPPIHRSRAGGNPR
jgi:hypothetical protein